MTAGTDADSRPYLVGAKGQVVVRMFVWRRPLCGYNRKPRVYSYT